MEKETIVFKIATKVWWDNYYKARTIVTRNGRRCKAIEIPLIEGKTWEWRLESNRRWEEGNTQYRELIFVHL